MGNPAFTAGLIAVTEREPNGDYVVRLMKAPTGWRQVGMSQRFRSRTDAVFHAAGLVVDHDAAILSDNATATSFPGWPFGPDGAQ